MSFRMRIPHCSRKASGSFVFFVFLLWSSVYLLLYSSILDSRGVSIQLKSIVSWNSPLRNNRNAVHVNDDDDNTDATDAEIDRSTMNLSSSCTPKHDIFFLKTHKCASSTLQNILMRYGLKHKLSFALPGWEHANIAGFPDYCQSRYIQPNRAMKFNIFCHHCRFHYALIRNLMPNETVFIGVVRNPSDVFQSGIRYSFQSNQSASSYVVDVKENRTRRMYYSQNPMLFDFGVETTENRTELRRRVRERVEQFDLILVSDYFEESIILMKDFLCWTVEDVAYVAHNQFTNAMRQELNATETVLLQEWNYGDGLLYSMVNRTFWMRVRKFGHRRMQSEVTQLRALRLQWESKCILKQATNSEIKDRRMKGWHPDTLGYVLKDSKMTDEACVYLTMSELKLTNILHDRQLKFFP